MGVIPTVCPKCFANAARDIPACDASLINVRYVIAAPVSGVKCLTGKDVVRRTLSYSSLMSNDAHSLKMSISVPED
jgi:hypothetical protein